LWSKERTSGVAIEKSFFSTVARWSGPSEAKSMRSSVLPRATIDQGTPQLEWSCLRRTRLTSGVLLRDDHGDLLNLGSPEEFVARSNHSIEAMNSSPEF